MVITRTPYRVSLFGGGCDFPQYYERHGARLISFTIDKFCHLSARWLPPFFEHKSRIVWSKLETVGSNTEIEHPSVRTCLSYFGIERGIEIHHDGDLPARSGLGSSSAFTVGLLNALHALDSKMVGPRELAREAIWIEQEKLKEAVGIQDQIACAFGGFNVIEILPTGMFHVNPFLCPQSSIEALQAHLMLFYTGVARSSSDVQQGHRSSIPAHLSDLRDMQALIDPAAKALSRCNIEEVGKLLHESWLLKRSVSPGATTGQIDAMYEAAREGGAIGGKILGAGGGGFMLVLAHPDNHEKVSTNLHGYLQVPIKIEFSGSRVIFVDR